MRSVWLMAIGLIAPLVAGCDPCSGIGTCSAPQLRYEGEVLQKYPEMPLEGVRVEFRRTGGVELLNSMLEGVTDRDGIFRIEGETRAIGTVVGSLVFRTTAGVPPTQIDDVRLETVRGSGDLGFAGTWKVPFPHLPYQAHFFHRATGAPASGMEVEFRRTGGIVVDPDTFRVTTDGFGNVKLRPLAREAGVVRGELLVFPLPPARPFQVRDVELKTFLELRFDSTVVEVGIGPLLPYAGTLVWSDTGDPAAGIRLEFRRISGIPVQPDPLVQTTDAFGTFHLNPAPLIEGVVTGVLVGDAGDGRIQEIRQLELDAQSADRPVQYLGLFSIDRPQPADSSNAR